MNNNLVEEIADFGVVLRPVATGDLEMIRRWRNHPDVARFMFSTGTITEEQQQRWFERVQSDSAQQHYVIEYRQEPIGVINGKSATGESLGAVNCIEVGMYLAPGCRYRGTVLAFCPALAFNRHCFEKLGCAQLQAEVLLDNQAAIRFNEKLGYTTVASDAQKIRMVVDSAAFQLAAGQLAPMIRF